MAKVKIYGYAEARRDARRLLGPQGAVRFLKTQPRAERSRLAKHSSRPSRRGSTGSGGYGFSSASLVPGLPGSLH